MVGGTSDDLGKPINTDHLHGLDSSHDLSVIDEDTIHPLLILPTVDCKMADCKMQKLCESN